MLCGCSGLLSYWPLVSVFGLCEDAGFVQNHGVLHTEDSASAWLAVPPAQAPVSGRFHTRFGEYLVAGDVDLSAVSSSGGLLLPFAAAAPSTRSGDALWAGAADPVGGALWQRSKVVLDTGFTSSLTFGGSESTAATAFVLHLQPRSLTAVIPVPASPPLPPARGGSSQQLSAHHFSPFFAASPTAPVVIDCCVAVTVQPLSAGDVRMERITIQLYTITSGGVYNTLMHSTHMQLAAQPSAPHNIGLCQSVLTCF